MSANNANLDIKIVPKRGKSKKKKTRRPKQKKKQSMQRPKLQTGRKGITMKHIRGVCSIYDPFCPAAKGSKIPDGTSGNTMTEQLRYNYSIQTQAVNGNSVLGVATSAPYGYVGTASSTPTTCTMGTGWTLFKATSLVATYGNQVRIVSMGVIVRCIANSTVAAGTITLGTSGAAIALGGVITLGSNLYDEVITRAIQPGLELSWIAQPRGSSSRSFETPSTPTVVTNDWTNLVIEIAGAPSATYLIAVEFFVNVEFTMANNAALSSLAPANPPSVPQALTAVSKVNQSLGSFIEGGITAVERSVEKHVKEALVSVFDDPLESIAALFF